MPRDINSRTVASPIPLLAPVIMAVLPSNSLKIMFLFKTLFIQFIKAYISPPSYFDLLVLRLLEIEAGLCNLRDGQPD